MPLTLMLGMGPSDLVAPSGWDWGLWSVGGQLLLYFLATRAVALALSEMGGAGSRGMLSMTIGGVGDYLGTRLSPRRSARRSRRRHDSGMVGGMGTLITFALVPLWVFCVTACSILG